MYKYRGQKVALEIFTHKKVAVTSFEAGERLKTVVDFHSMTLYICDIQINHFHGAF